MEITYQRHVYAGTKERLKCQKYSFTVKNLIRYANTKGGLI